MSIPKFAKLFDICPVGTQVLIYLEYDADEDETNIVNITNIEGYLLKMKLGFQGEDQEEKSRAAFERIDQQKAEKIYESFKKMLEE